MCGVWQVVRGLRQTIWHKSACNGFYSAFQSFTLNLEKKKKQQLLYSLASSPQHLQCSIQPSGDCRHHMLQWIKALAPHYGTRKSRNSPCFSLRHLSSFLYGCVPLSFYLLSLSCPTVINDNKFSQMTTSSLFFYFLHSPLMRKKSCRQRKSPRSHFYLWCCPW